MENSFSSISCFNIYHLSLSSWLQNLTLVKKGKKFPPTNGGNFFSPTLRQCFTYCTQTFSESRFLLPNLLVVYLEKKSLFLRFLPHFGEQCVPLLPPAVCLSFAESLILLRIVKTLFSLGMSDTCQLLKWLQIDCRLSAIAKEKEELFEQISSSSRKPCFKSTGWDLKANLTWMNSRKLKIEILKAWKWSLHLFAGDQDQVF